MGKVIIGLQSKEGLAAIEPKTRKLLWAYEDGASTIPSSSWTGKNIALVPSNGITALKVDEDLTSFRQIWKKTNSIQELEVHPLGMVSFM